MIIESNKKRFLPGELCHALPLQSLTNIELAEVYAFVLAKKGRGTRLNIVADELNKRPTEHLSQNDIEDICDCDYTHE